jgi:uncharacterized membrane protein YjgN (DUF898 family)
MSMAPSLNVTVAAPGPLTGRIKADISVGRILGHIIIWVVLTIITVGIAAFFYPYAFATLVVNRCSIIDSQGRVSRLKCELNVFSQLGHIILWFLLTLITCGIAFFFYLFKVFNYVLNNTTVVPA